MEQVEVDLTKHKFAFAIPCYDGKVQVDTMTSLLETCGRLTQMGITWQFITIKGSALIDATRNEIMHKFLHETECDILINIDSDISWSWESMERLLVFSTIYDSMAGVYCSRTDPPKFHLNLLDTVPDENGLVRHNGTGFGFVSLKREVLEKMDVSTFKHKKYDDRMRVFFKQEVQNDTFIGEDIYFFREMVKQGFTAYADINITLKHHGPKDYDYQLNQYVFKKGEI